MKINNTNSSKGGVLHDYLIETFALDMNSEVERAVVEQTLNFIRDNASDGYHTFKELYRYRLLYNAALFNEWFEQGKYNVHKSERHSDGQLCFGGGWFIVQATLPTGQISNHYELKDWYLFKATIKKKADKFDGHTPQDVAMRLELLLPEQPAGSDWSEI